MNNTSSFSWPNSFHRLLSCRFLSLLLILGLLDVLGHGTWPNTHIWALIPTIAPQNSTLLLIGKKKGDFDSLMTTLITLMSFLSVQVSFQLQRGTLLTLWHLGRFSIYFLQRHVPHVLWCDGDPTVENFIGVWAGTVSLTFPFHIYIYILLKDFSCSTFCIFNSQKLVRGAILHFRKLPLALLFKFRTFSSLASLISPRHPNTFNYFNG